MPDLLRALPAPDYRYFELAGDHYACGRQMGQATELRQLDGRPADLAFAAACAEAVRAQHAPLIEEYRGYADAQGRPWSDVLPHFSLNHPAGLAGGCSTLVWRAENGHVMVARNYDFAAYQRARHLIRSAPPAVEPVLGTNAGLIGGRYDGVNAAGVFVALHLVRADLPARVGPGVPFHLVPRILLETCQTARQALSRLRAMPLLFPFNYVIADANDFFAVETYPGAIGVRRGEDVLVTTNHYQHPDLERYHGGRKADDSRRRAARLLELWAERRGDPLAWSQVVLADHIAPLCHHERALATLWALTVDLTARRLAYCPGPPCQTPFSELPWPSRPA